MDSLEPQLLLGMLAWVVAFVFGKHLQAGFAQWRNRALAEQPIRRDR